MKVTKPLFSVVIPLFNKRVTIASTVASILAQTFLDFELIVIDDGSTDGGAGELTGIDDARLTVIRQNNLGEGPARNRGIEAAKGEWIAFLDADDLWLPWHLDELDRVRRRFPDAGLIGSRWIEADPGAIPDSPPRMSGEIEVVSYFDEVLGAPLVRSSTAAVRRSAYDDVGGFSNWRTGSDIEYWARLALKWPVARSTAVTAVYRRTTGDPDPDGGEVDGIVPVIAVLRRDRATLPAATALSVDRYIRTLWESRFRALVSRDRSAARRLLAIAPERLSAPDRLRKVALGMPDPSPSC